MIAIAYSVLYLGHLSTYGILTAAAPSPHKDIALISSNKVTFNPKDGGHACFTLDDYLVTPGESSDILKGDQGCTDVSFRFNRKGSKDVGNWWNQRFPAGSNTFGHTADKLNFAAIGNLTISWQDTSYEIASVGLAQGHSGTTNNWWFGCQNPVSLDKGSNKITCSAVQTGTNNTGNFLFKRGGNSVDHVDFSNVG